MSTKCVLINGCVHNSFICRYSTVEFDAIIRLILHKIEYSKQINKLGIQIAHHFGTISMVVSRYSTVKHVLLHLYTCDYR